MSKQPPPAPTASAVGPCPTVIQIVGRLGTGSLPSTIALPTIIDAMTFIRKHQCFGCSTFKELQAAYLNKILHSRPRDCKVVNVVRDRYDFAPSKSLKQEERESVTVLLLAPGKCMNLMILLICLIGINFHIT